MTEQIPSGPPTLVALGLAMAGAGLIGMTAGELPGIAQQLEAPRWLMGILGGVLIGCGAQAGGCSVTTAWLRSWPRWLELVAYGIAGLVLARLSDLTRAAGGEELPLASGVALNGTGRILFGIGTGIVIGWVAYEASRGRSRSGGS